MRGCATVLVVAVALPFAPGLGIRNRNAKHQEDREQGNQGSFHFFDGVTSGTNAPWRSIIRRNGVGNIRRPADFVRSPVKHGPCAAIAGFGGWARCAFETPVRVNRAVKTQRVSESREGGVIRR
jgi:hypothetical protein